MIERLMSNNVVAQTELNYRTRRGYSANRRMRRNAFYITLVVWAVLLLMTVLLSVVQGANLLSTSVTTFIFGVGVTGLHFALMLRTLTLSAGAIGREKRNTERWEALVLTGISAREIIVGKWWMVMCIMWREYALLAFLRLVMLSTVLSTYIFYPAGLVNVPVLMLGLLTPLVLTMLNLPFTAACGILSSMETKRGGGLPRAFAGRFAFALLPGVLPIIVMSLLAWRLRNWGVLSNELYYAAYDFFNQFLRTAADNGVTLAQSFFLAWRRDSFPLMNVVVLIAAVVVYSWMTWALLRLAEFGAVRAGALKETEVRADAVLVRVSDKGQI